MSSPPLAALASLVLAVLGLVLLLPDCASACSCGGGGSKKPLSMADEDLALLGDGEKPTDGAALNDTSGGVPVRMAGLVMAASFLLVVRLAR